MNTGEVIGYSREDISRMVDDMLDSLGLPPRPQHTDEERELIQRRIDEARQKIADKETNEDKI